MSSAPSLTQLGEQLHTRLIAGDDPIVTNEIVEVFLARLINRLSRHFPNVSDKDLMANAAEDALLSYFNDPARFTPERGSLMAWLGACARHNLLDTLRQQNKHYKSEKVVELSEVEAVYQAEAENELLERSADEGTMKRLSTLLPDPTDLRLALLMMEGIRETTVFAAVLKITELSPEEQQQIVKRHKDRLKKTIQRHYKIEE
jgi:RNA polymerase sigma-70 factor, ECF subfamily